MNKPHATQPGYSDVVRSALAAAAEVPSWLRTSARPSTGHTIPIDFIGVNVAPGIDSQTEDYILQSLRDLNVHSVRMHYTYESPDSPAQRLLDRLIASGFKVVLCVFPELDRSQRLSQHNSLQDQWRQFLIELFTRYENQVELFEIGNTPNRRKWSAFTGRSAVTGWDIAREVASQFSVTLAGPNISDFEPLYNSCYLSLFGRFGQVPAVHTDNLFVERVVEPEAYDHRALGRWLTRAARLNVIKKARILHDLGQKRGSQRLICTYTCWTFQRLARRSLSPHTKQADYIVRYLVLAAASGALSRVYWGPLICHRDGLIDDACEEYPAIDQVSYYRQVKGDKENFFRTPAFNALTSITERLSGATIVRAQHDPLGASLFEFTGVAGDFFAVAWTRDRQCIGIGELLGAASKNITAISDALGEPYTGLALINEHPLILDLESPLGKLPKSPKSTRSAVQINGPTLQSLPWQTEGWRGDYCVPVPCLESESGLHEALSPAMLPSQPELKVLRDARNRLWNIQDPRHGERQITVKLNRVKGIKKFTYRFRPSKGLRHFSNACAMLGRGIATPAPIAYFERADAPGVQNSWYLCEFIPDAFSAKDVYRVLNEGEPHYRNLDANAWFTLLSEFVCRMHDMQIVHRDLSAGNLLISQSHDGSFTPIVIDIGRAWIWHGPGSRVTGLKRLQDLIRIAYKLSWQDREAFVRCYEQHWERPLPSFWRLGFVYYDAKQALKRRLRALRR
ncbi:MAG: lipopolysaccharide kinase InaA family protein [Halioglobus sp.]